MKNELSLDELVLCAIFSAGLDSTEYKKLEEKSQIIKMYNQEPTKNFKMFLNFDKLVERINAIKNGEYVVHITKELEKKESINRLKEQGIAKVVEEIDLEDMFCALLTDKVDVEAAKDLLEYFLNKEYFNKKNVVTNRLMHSLQVMLGTGLACKSLNATFDETFTCMIISAFHDIGHVPFAHVMEQIIKYFLHSFSHETNGKRVFGEIVKNNKNQMVAEITRYLQDDFQDVRKSIDEKAQIIEDGIVEHSRTNSKKRKKGLHVQIARALDKILYFASDTHDLTAVPKGLTKKQRDMQNEELFLNDLLSNENDVEQDSKEYMEFIQALKERNFGKAVAIASSSITPEKVEYEDREMVYYNVDKDIWQSIIDKTKKLYKGYDFEVVRKKMEMLSIVVLAKITASKYYGKDNSLSDAFYEAIDEITCMGEKDLYDYCSSLTITTNTKFQDKKLVDSDLVGRIKEQIKVNDGMTDTETLSFFKDILVLSENEIQLMEEIRKNNEDDVQK